MRKTVEELLQTPYWIVDILPAQVPADSAGQYFAVEKYLRQKERLAEIKGISMRKAMEIAVQMEEKKDLREALLFRSR